MLLLALLVGLPSWCAESSHCWLTMMFSHVQQVLAQHRAGRHPRHVCDVIAAAAPECACTVCKSMTSLRLLTVQGGR